MEISDREAKIFLTLLETFDDEDLADNLGTTDDHLDIIREALRKNEGK